MCAEPIEHFSVFIKRSYRINSLRYSMIGYETVRNISRALESMRGGKDRYMGVYLAHLF